jgi:hypothetical protein
MEIYRAVPTGFRLGGCIPKFGPPSIPGPLEWKGAQIGGGPKCWRHGEGVIFSFFDVIFSKTKVPEIFRKPTFFQFQHARAPFPQVGPPFFTFFGGCYTPHTPPGGTALEIYKYYQKSILFPIKVHTISILWIFKIFFQWYISGDIITRNRPDNCDHKMVDFILKEQIV